MSSQSSRNRSRSRSRSLSQDSDPTDYEDWPTPETPPHQIRSFWIHWQRRRVGPGVRRWCREEEGRGKGAKTSNCIGLRDAASLIPFIFTHLPAGKPSVHDCKPCFKPPVVAVHPASFLCFAGTFQIDGVFGVHPASFFCFVTTFQITADTCQMAGVVGKHGVPLV
jgi:hypothetical protein